MHCSNVFTSREFVDVNVGLNCLLVLKTFPSPVRFCEVRFGICSPSSVSMDSAAPGLGPSGSKELSGGTRSKCCVSGIMVRVEFKGGNSSEENTGVVVDFCFFGDFSGICSCAISREHVGFCACVPSIVSELISMLSFSPDGDFFKLPSEEVVAFSSNVSVSFVGWSF